MLGKARIADAISMMMLVLQEGTAGHVLTNGLTGGVTLLAKVQQLGDPTEMLIHEKEVSPYIAGVRKLLKHYKARILNPIDLAFVDGGCKEIALENLSSQTLLVDIGDKTIERHTGIIHQAETVFINGPPGIYEEAVSAPDTEQLLTAVAEGSGCLIIGGGDGVATTGGLRCQRD